jgi:hypothetical protein
MRLLIFIDHSSELEYTAEEVRDEGLGLFYGVFRSFRGHSGRGDTDGIPEQAPASF